MHMATYIYISIYVYTRMHVCMYTYTYVCMYMCLCVYASMTLVLGALQARRGPAGVVALASCRGLPSNEGYVYVYVREWGGH